MRPFEGRRVLLGVTGGIACYKSIFVARELTLAGAEVDVVLTRAALEFVGRITFEAVTGRATHTELLESGQALAHIRLAREADVVVVAPATADFCARAAHGRADDLLAACLLATDAPVLVVPAMNDRMWAHPQTAANVAHLRKLRYGVLDPEVGALAAGEGSGAGRMPEPSAIVSQLARLLEGDSLRGRRVLVTAGPTREAVDPVRYISNESSGRMGVAIAEAAWRRGADVVLVHGPLAIPLPAAMDARAVTTTAEMCAAVRDALPESDVLVMAAAPADFRVRDAAPRKHKKGNGVPQLALEATPDILLSTRDARRAGAVIVGFALETGNPVPAAREKLAAKALDLVVANDASELGAGFGGDTNRVTLVGATGDEPLPLLPKRAVAEALLDRVERLLEARDGR